MSHTNKNSAIDESESVYREYILGVRIVAVRFPGENEPQYRFEAPEHIEIHFENPELAELYADIYFDVNGFEEAGTGERGVPPEIIQAGRDTLAAYFLTQPYSDINWVASFYGKKPTEIERYVASVRKRAQEIRDGAEEMGMD
ncbi:hypothetical protein SAMN05421858_1110 [Haladaptatus litoreus]|uniref:Uncharacterized protein n=1 Tax=Haladaptatus litoreus TaxID=553468 RepID=A0A1N6XF41_9EURY|nr:hypothetical protein [Haladaptatus litoreus]SIR00978.1 hypothetical protein SAMN05421858_1110 [Haladaptatus litoreus]